MFPSPAGARNNNNNNNNVKPSNKRFIIPLQKGVILLQFYLERVF